MNDGASRLLKVAELWQRTAKSSGKTYYSGFWRDCQVLMFDGGEKDHQTREGERVHIWRLFLQERDASRRPQKQPARTQEPEEALL